jgi:hypothetical protein
MQEPQGQQPAHAGPSRSSARRPLLVLAVCAFLGLPLLLGGGACWWSAKQGLDASTGWNPVPRPVEMACAGLHPPVAMYGGTGVLVGWLAGAGFLAAALWAGRRAPTQGAEKKAATAATVIGGLGTAVLVPLGLGAVGFAWCVQHNIRGPECERREVAAAASYRALAAGGGSDAHAAEAVARALDAHDIRASCLAARAVPRSAIGAEPVARRALEHAWDACSDRASFDAASPGGCLPR